MKPWLPFAFVLAYVPLDGQAARSQTVDASSLVGQLRLRSDSDQAVRRDLFACGSDEAERRRLTEIIRKGDQSNLAWLKEVVAQNGWPGKSLVGAEGAHCAWLLVQHADGDRDFQELCLRKMESLPPGEVTASQIAYLTDRILVGRGQQQKYGTQVAVEGEKVRPCPIDDEPHVDQRRRAVGLEPLDKYLKAVEVFCAHRLTARERPKR